MGGQHSRDHDHHLHLVTANAAGPSPAVDFTDRSIISRFTMNRGSRRSFSSYPYPRTHTTVMVVPKARSPVVELQSEPQPFVRPPLNRAIPTIHESRSNESIKTQMSTSESRHSVVGELIPQKTIVEGDEPLSSLAAGSLVIENRLASRIADRDRRVEELDNRQSGHRVVIESPRVTPRSEPRSPLMTVAHSVRNRLSKLGSRFSRSHDTGSPGSGSGFSSKSGSTRSLSSSVQLMRRASSSERRRPDVNANFEAKLFKSSSMEVAMNNPVVSSSAAPLPQNLPNFHHQRPNSRPPPPPPADNQPSTIIATLPNNTNNNSFDMSPAGGSIMAAAVEIAAALKEPKPVAVHKPPAVLPKPCKASKQSAEEGKKSSKVASLIPKAISSSMSSKLARPKDIAGGMTATQKLPRYPPRCAPLAESESSTVENSPAVELAPTAFPGNQVSSDQQQSIVHPVRKGKIPSPGQRRKVLPVGKSPLAVENDRNSALSKKEQALEFDGRTTTTTTTASMVIPYSSSSSRSVAATATPIVTANAGDTSPGAIERLAMNLSKQSAYAQSRLRATTAQLYATRTRQVYSPNGVIVGTDKSAVVEVHAVDTADTHQAEAGAAASPHIASAPLFVASTSPAIAPTQTDDVSLTINSSLTTPSSCALTTGSTSASSKPTSPAASDGTRRGLIDDEIKDQPMLVGHRYSLENSEEAHDVIASLDPAKNRLQNMQAWRRNRTPRDSLVSTGSLDGDEVIFDYESSMDEEASPSPYRGARLTGKQPNLRRDSGHSQRSSIKTPTGGSKRNSVDLEAAEAELCLLVDRISVESASLQVASNRRRSAGDGTDKEQHPSESSSNTVVTAAPVGSSKLRPPSALSADASGLDCVAFPDPHTYAAACREVIALKTQLLQLQSLLQSTQTANPFESALMQVSSSSTDHTSTTQTQRPPPVVPNGPTIPSEDKRQLDIITRENDLLKRQMFEKDRLIETLRRQISEHKS